MTKTSQAKGLVGWTQGQSVQIRHALAVTVAFRLRWDEQETCRTRSYTFVPPSIHEASVPTDMFGLIAGIAIGLLVGWVYLLVWKARYTTVIRDDAVQRSQAVTIGKVHEQLVPYLSAFPYNPKDVRFLGSPIDLVVFDGLAEGRVRRIVFLEVKTGGSTLTSRERSVRDVIQAREIEWAELRVARSVASGAA